MLNNLNYNITFIKHDNHLEAVTTGTITGAQQMIEYSGIPIQKAIELGYKKVLIDERKININLSDTDFHEIMNFFLNNFPKSLEIKFVAVYAKENETGVLIFDELAKKVGFDCTFFLNKEDAVKHLGC